MSLMHIMRVLICILYEIINSADTFSITINYYSMKEKIAKYYTLLELIKFERRK